MSWRSDSSQLFAGKWTSSLYAGHGIHAQNIPSTGTSGAGYLFNDIAAQGMAATDEVRGEILTWPSAGTLTVNEDSSFSFSAPDGSYNFGYRGYRNGASYGDYTAALTIGGAATTSTVNYDMGGFTFAASANVTAPASDIPATVAYDMGWFTFSVSAGQPSVAFVERNNIEYPTVVSVTTLSTSTPIFYEQSGMLVIINNTGAAVNPKIIGDASGQFLVGGVGYIDLSGGYPCGTLPAGGIMALKLESIREWMRGNAFVTNAAGCTAFVLY